MKNATIVALTNRKSGLLSHSFAKIISKRLPPIILSQQILNFNKKINIRILNMT